MNNGTTQFYTLCYHMHHRWKTRSAAETLKFCLALIFGIRFSSKKFRENYFVKKFSMFCNHSFTRGSVLFNRNKKFISIWGWIKTISTLWKAFQLYKPPSVTKWIRFIQLILYCKIEIIWMMANLSIIIIIYLPITI